MRTREARTAGQMPRTSTTTTVATRPEQEDQRVEGKPVEGSARRASPTGVSGDRAKATTTAPAAPTSATTRFRAVPSTTSWRGASPGRPAWGTPRSRPRSGDRAPGRRRPGRPGRPGRPAPTTPPPGGGSMPPPRWRWCPGSATKTRMQGVDVGVESGEVRGAVAKPDEVLGSADGRATGGGRTPASCTGRRWRPVPAGNSDSAASIPTTWKATVGPVGRHVRAVDERLSCDEGVERGVDHRSDVDAVVLFEVERGQRARRATTGSGIRPATSFTTRSMSRGRQSSWIVEVRRC